MGTRVFNWPRVAVTPERNSRTKSTTMTCNVTQRRRSRIVLDVFTTLLAPSSFFFFTPPEVTIIGRGRARSIVCARARARNRETHLPSRSGTYIFVYVSRKVLIYRVYRHGGFSLSSVALSYAHSYVDACSPSLRTTFQVVRVRLSKDTNHRSVQTMRDLIYARVPIILDNEG